MLLNPIAALSIAAPAYNEAAGIEQVVRDWAAYLRPRVPHFEIVICNDGSSDSTLKILQRLQQQEVPELKILNHARNRGAAEAFATAIRGTSLDWVLLMDSDGQFPIDNLEAMALQMQIESAEAVLGVRTKKCDSLFARFGSYASGQVCNLIYGTRFRDFNSAFKLISGPVIRTMPLNAKGLNSSTEVTARLIEMGIKISEVDITHSPRESGTTSRKFFKSSFERAIFVASLGLRQTLGRS
jgi:dolichol-phosphate mannosyltransferase